MEEGLIARYQDSDIDTAIERFQEVLALVPQHSGALRQLAAALDAWGTTTESLSEWMEALWLALLEGYVGADVQHARERTRQLALRSRRGKISNG